MDVKKKTTNLITIKLCSECGCLSYYDWGKAMKKPNLRKDYHVGFKGRYTIGLHGNSIFTKQITFHRYIYDKNYRKITFVALVA